jgi:hypothetical protein
MSEEVYKKKIVCISNDVIMKYGQYNTRDFKEMK